VFIFTFCSKNEHEVKLDCTLLAVVRMMGDYGSVESEPCVAKNRNGIWYLWLSRTGDKDLWGAVAKARTHPYRKVSLDWSGT